MFRFGTIGMENSAVRAFGAIFLSLAIRGWHGFDRRAVCIHCSKSALALDEQIDIATWDLNSVVSSPVDRLGLGSKGAARANSRGSTAILCCQGDGITPLTPCRFARPPKGAGCDIPETTCAFRRRRELNRRMGCVKGSTPSFSIAEAKG